MNTKYSLNVSAVSAEGIVNYWGIVTSKESGDSSLFHGMSSRMDSEVCVLVNAMEEDLDMEEALELFVDDNQSYTVDYFAMADFDISYLDDDDVQLLLDKVLDEYEKR